MKVNRNAGKANRNLKHNEVGAGDKPRLKGNSSTTNVGKGTNSGGRSDTTDRHRGKRGDSQAGRASNYLTDSTKAHRSKNSLSKPSSEMSRGVKKPLTRGE